MAESQNRHNTKYNSQMIKYLRYIDWVLLGFNVLASVFFFRPIRSFSKAKDTIWSEFYNLTADFWEYGFIYVYPVVWCVLWCVRIYYKVKFSFVWLLNTLFLILALFWLLVSLLGNPIEGGYIY